MNRFTRKILEKTAATRFVRKAISDKANLSPFKERPNPRTIAGISAIGISYIIGWPAVAFLGIVSLHYEKPMIAIIGGPLTYGLSHLVFILGMYLAGADYTRVFLRWATRKTMEKLMGNPNEHSNGETKKPKL
ncbi:MAG: hypothetical protein B6240_02325 [Desulfobacteraceae bacterium 4572_87]|nr:MAG: hypothetical protein B6240_02325 [Desulfobacteraceae bacterium 4572_87]